MAGERHYPIPKFPQITREGRNALLRVGLLGGLGLSLFAAQQAGFIDSKANSNASGGNDDGSARLVLDASTAIPEPTETLVPYTPTPRATATVLADRTDCNQIAGTPYRSDAERDHFLKNCMTAVQPTIASFGTGSSSGPSRVVEQSQSSPRIETNARSSIFFELRPTEGDAVANAVNILRTNRGLKPLKFNPVLKKAADDYLKYLHDSNWLDNIASLQPITPDPHTRNGYPADRARAAGYRGKASEVINLYFVYDPNFVAGDTELNAFARFSAGKYPESEKHMVVITGDWDESAGSCMWEGTLARPHYVNPIRVLVCVDMVGKLQS